MAITTELAPTPETKSTVEPTPQTETPKAAPEEDKTSDAVRFAQLARREKMLRSRAQEIQARELAIKQKEQELSSPREPDNSWKQKLLDDPMGVLNEAGLSYDQLTNIMLNQNPLDPQVRSLQAQLKAMSDKQAELDKKFEEKDTHAYSQALNQIGHEVKQMVNTSEEFESIKFSGKSGIDAVVKLIEKTFNEDGYLLPVEEAINDVEEYLTEQYTSIGKLKKIQSRLTPKQEEALETSQKPQSQQGPKVTPKAAPQTLTHAIQQQSKPLTSQERRERAIAAFHGKLTS